MSENHTDAMISRLETEIEERNAVIEGVTGSAQKDGRDLLPTETELCIEARKRIEACEVQLETLYESRNGVQKARRRHHEVARELSRLRKEDDHGEIEYRSAGAFIVDTYQAALGNRDARARIETYIEHRVAAHQLTEDNPGVIPDPVVGPVLSFIDSARPLVQALGVQPLPGGSFHRPKVTQHTQVGRQTDGETDEQTEKVELVSRKMTIQRLSVQPDTYGGYVNVSRQNIDFSSPQIFDIIVNDLAEQYAIETEAALADVIGAVATTPVEYPLTTGGNFTENKVKQALWAAAGDVYSAIKGRGRVVLALAPDRLEKFGPLFDPNLNPMSGGGGLTAGNFGQGIMGTISGIPVIMSAGLGSNEAFLLSTAALEVWEQRIGTLQVVEPSVLGVQVAYAGYFASLVTAAGGIVPLEEGTA